jgi:uncharacterized protein YbjT (DUF2867 family)
MKSVIITGSTGMVGKGVLLECLDHPDITQVLLINRTSIEMKHPKLKELLLKDFTEINTLKDELGGYDACFFCMGISAIGMDEGEYTKITFDPVKAFVDVLFELSPKMVFNYVSGTGTDSSAKGKSMWARVKGETENYVLAKGFKEAFMFRPGIIIPERGIESKVGWYNFMYKAMRPFFPLFKKSKNVTTTSKIGTAMIKSLTIPFNLKHLENSDINDLAEVV